uniref:Phosphatidylinositol transfer protein SFH5 n=1 Tax=Bionectria ochroleuca TaxID=29856 RepID=A0A0B7K3J8_BIOOC
MSAVEEKTVAAAAPAPGVEPTAEPVEASKEEAPKTEAAKEEAAKEEAPKTEAAKEEAKEETKKDEAKEETKEEAPKKPETALSKLTARLPEILKKAEHTEMWGIELKDIETSIPAKIVLQKFLRAKGGDVDVAAKQLEDALKWRKELKPTELVERSFDADTFEGLGYATVHKNAAGQETVITWNIYGAVKSFKKTFGDVDEFVRWRTALMELGVQKLRIDAATEPISDDPSVADPYKMVQVHDYLSVSFLRMDPHVKAASKQTIDAFATAYPELLEHKYFVNVPTIMGWMYAAMKLFLAPATLKKFHPMSDGTTLAAELPQIKSSLPKEYGGEGPSVKEGEAIKLVKKEPEPAKKEESKEEKKEETKAEKKEEAKEEAKEEEVKEVVKEEPKKEETKEEETKKEEAKAEESKKQEEPTKDAAE